MTAIGYRDEQGRLLVVSDGISWGTSWSVYHRKPSGSLKRHTGFPVRATRAEAERDLEERAAKRRWQPVTIPTRGLPL